MPNYEVSVKRGFASQDIVADNAAEAKKMLVELIVDNLDVDHVEAICLDDDEDDG